MSVWHYKIRRIKYIFIISIKYQTRCTIVHISITTSCARATIMTMANSHELHSDRVLHTNNKKKTKTKREREGGEGRERETIYELLIRRNVLRDDLDWRRHMKRVHWLFVHIWILILKRFTLPYGSEKTFETLLRNQMPQNFLFSKCHIRFDGNEWIYVEIVEKNQTQLRETIWVMIPRKNVYTKIDAKNFRFKSNSATTSNCR